MIQHPSPNHEARRVDVIDMLVLHYTGMPSAELALHRLCDPAAKVSAHYLIDEDGTVLALVPEDRRAWHAGLSSWRGHTDINSRSIGIELVNPGHEFGYRPFPDAQIDALIALAQKILTRHPITARNVVGHSDIAPSRKTDPGELFPWQRLKSYGIGLWPFSGQEKVEWLPQESLRRLAEYGYDISDPVAAMTAFQRHFRPDLINGGNDAETAGRIERLLGALRPGMAPVVSYEGG
ncbi:N-acetylmuramoyl-L-alanine amidase [Magnetospirillum gryphiswaldense]|uniref:N-acetylmuramoyl-L-alanine amidase n=1 Tax=Magnetospirillum gryphiswaldense TaxID=55518 RepID=A4TZP2_9PROT|nr:N-acetylmuramoyl-L-alanine amidase [Magnetospirillum gryphiswaldense]AVM75051.1 N-acetylmuramoyl-L-alanine amidase AmiD precursor [Magnetospirillum gryphiswaldense MSR-1]AVM78954.1 N-acetylmuramoyl-L-alanine amidase AmiD precursor [Magnetospirillum gryphiswaldense]CAM76099.1 N-acetylmuramoyl-L-alanine amidase, family 2 [Magnetospirillum gryphiswaldense MSR-1]